MTARPRAIAFVVIATILVLAAVAFVLFTANQPLGPSGAPAPTPVRSPVAPATQPYIAFRRTTLDESRGTVGTVPPSDPSAAPATTPLECERIHLSRYGGVCLAVDRTSVTTAKVLLLNSDLSLRHLLTTPGIPSRARVSPDGRWAATTTFVTGHSYSAASFSTVTEIYDMLDGRSLGNLEGYTFVRAGEPYANVDVNVWGVTFSDQGTFYATVLTQGFTHLAHGDIATREIQLTDVSAECPSLSPDRSRLAFKHATGPDTWEIRVRDISTGEEVTLAESRSVDDQIEWLDDDRVVYGLNRGPGQPDATTDVWVTAADGSGQPVLFIEAAWSPAVVRVP